MGIKTASSTNNAEQTEYMNQNDTRSLFLTLHVNQLKLDQDPPSKTCILNLLV